jgi:hypothetical protein
MCDDKGVGVDTNAAQDHGTETEAARQRDDCERRRVSGGKSERSLIVQIELETLEVHCADTKALVQPRHQQAKTEHRQTGGRTALPRPTAPAPR